MGKARGVVVGCVSAVGIAASLASASEEATPVDDDEAATDDGATGETASTFAIGDRIELRDLQLVVHGVTDPMVASNDVVVPAAGMRWVAVDTEVLNVADEPVAISLLAQFEIQDATNAAYHVTVTGENLPSIDGEARPAAVAAAPWCSRSTRRPRGSSSSSPGTCWRRVRLLSPSVEPAVASVDGVLVVRRADLAHAVRRRPVRHASHTMPTASTSEGSRTSAARPGGWGWAPTTAATGAVRRGLRRRLLHRRVVHDAQGGRPIATWASHR
jgi:hypothetical protein